MKTRLNVLPLIALFFVTIAAFGQATKPANSKTADQGGPQVKALAPSFSVTALDGRQFDLSSLRGKIVVLNFWSISCPPCLDEIPKLNKLVEEFGGKDVVFIAPTWDGVDALRPFLKELPFKYHVVPNASDLVIDTYGQGGRQVALPMHYVIDREGRIDLKMEGSLRIEKLREGIARLLHASGDKGGVKNKS